MQVRVLYSEQIAIRLTVGYTRFFFWVNLESPKSKIHNYMTTKYCKYCDSTYPESFFGIALTTDTKVYRRNKCNTCYQKTKRIHKHSKSDWLTEYKKTLKCDSCGFSDYRALQFHHISDKLENVSSMVASHSIENIKEEISKCRVLCAKLSLYFTFQ
jgi:hypothetical protein